MRNIRKQLYVTYMEELYTIEGLELLSEHKLNEYFTDIIENPYLEWIDIYLPNLNEPVGFLVIAKYPECHPDADYYIAETYIKPEYRRQNIMLTTVSNYIKNHTGIYSLFIASKNDVAKKFWERVFKNVNYVPIYLSEEPIREPSPHFIQYGYKPKEQNDR